MVTAGAQARLVVGELLDRSVSPLLAAAGFRPRTKALAYTRRVPGRVRQEVRFWVQTRAEVEGAHITSTCRLSHDAVRALVHAWWDESPTSADAGLPDQLGIWPDFHPHGSQRRHWSEQAAPRLGEELRASVELDVLPLLAELEEPGAVAAASDEGRLPPGGVPSNDLYVVAAEAAAGRPAAAATRLRAFAERQPASLRPRLREGDVLARLGG